jgi:hypothetical protein
MESAEALLPAVLVAVSRRAKAHGEIFGERTLVPTKVNSGMADGAEK